MGLKKYARKREDKLISLSDINEELFPIEGYEDFATKSGKFYKYYFDDKYFPKTPIINNHNGYMYVALTRKDTGKNQGRRVHVILANLFIDNPDPIHYTLVGHKDNNKQNNSLDNLYWTNGHENTQKAVDDGLLVNKKSIYNENSQPIAVYSIDTNELVGVYGSISECARCVENSSKGYIGRMIKIDNYKPREKIYIYKSCSKEFYNQNINLANIKLTDVKSKKTQFIFLLKNSKYHLCYKLDNQTEAEKISGIPQGIISRLLINNRTEEYNGWQFIKLGETTYKDSSAYINQINTFDSYVIRNINTGEIKEFDTRIEVGNFLGLNGHDLSLSKLLNNEWVLTRTQRIDKNKFSIVG